MQVVLGYGALGMRDTLPHLVRQNMSDVTGEAVAFIYSQLSLSG